MGRSIKRSVQALGFGVQEVPFEGLFQGFYELLQGFMAWGRKVTGPFKGKGFTKKNPSFRALGLTVQAPRVGNPIALILESNSQPRGSTPSAPDPTARTLNLSSPLSRS